MCGVLGITILNFDKKDYDIVRSLFRQSMIRGKHATGVSYVKNDKVHTVKEPIPADEFISKQNLEDWKNEDGNLYCIGHIRYSTSDLRYNQPFSTDKTSIVHNGVISQEPQTTWETTYKLKTETPNDSELILRAIENDLNPLQHFEPSSMAVCTLYNDKSLVSFRNNERPLYYSDNEKIKVFASTRDILKRSGLTNVFKTEMYTLYKLNNFKLSTQKIATTGIEDLQNENFNY